MPGVPAPNSFLSRTVRSATTQGWHLIDTTLHVNKWVYLFVEKRQGPFHVKAGKATCPSEGMCGKEKEVDARLDFDANFCRGRFPCEQPRREKEQNEGFRGEVSPEELTVPVPSLEVETGQPRVSQDMRTVSRQHTHLLSQCVPLLFLLRAGLCRRGCSDSSRP